MIALITDSAAMLPAAIRERHGIGVVATTVTVDGVEFAEGVDLATEEFYARMADGATVSTSAPSPGSFAAAYRAAAGLGATAVLSVHTGSDYSATVTSATLAATMVDIPVTIVDTGVASFPVALATWAAAEALDGGGSVADAAATAERTAHDTASFFIVGVPAVAHRGGRFVAVDGELTPLTVLELSEGQLYDRGEVADLDAAIDVMIAGTLAAAASGALRVGVGHAVHPEVAQQMVDRLETQLAGSDLVTYEVGPSVGAHTGPGTLGIVFTSLEPGTVEAG